MFPFSVTHPRSATETGRHTANSGYELIAFDAEKLNVFAAEVRYCEPHWHPAPELITVLSGRFSIVVGQQSVEMVEGDMLYINAEAVHSLRAEAAGSSLVTVQFSPGLFDELHPAAGSDLVYSRAPPERGRPTGTAVPLRPAGSTD
ncbi:Cupin domain [Raoultella planticola]|nr:Cupin domain [Raoultella planticola]